MTCAYYRCISLCIVRWARADKLHDLPVSVSREIQPELPLPPTCNGCRMNSVNVTTVTVVPSEFGKKPVVLRFRGGFSLATLV